MKVTRKQQVLPQTVNRCIKGFVNLFSEPFFPIIMYPVKSNVSE